MSKPRRVGSLLPVFFAESRFFGRQFLHTSRQPLSQDDVGEVGEFVVRIRLLAACIRVTAAIDTEYERIPASLGAG